MIRFGKPPGAAVGVFCAGGALLALVACGRDRTVTLDGVEAIYQEARGIKDQIDVTRARGAAANDAGVSVEALQTSYREAGGRLQKALPPGAFAQAQGDDRAAVDIMRDALQKAVAEAAAGEAGAAGTVTPDAGAATPSEPDCAYDAEALARGPQGLETLTARVYACFGKAAQQIPFEGEQLDRLTIFSLLPLTADPGKRRRLFLAEQPIWSAVNGRNEPRSPYRILVRLSAAKMKQEGTTIESRAAKLGADPGQIEAWLVQVLEAWRAINPEAPIEPWDFAYRNGAASRALSPKVSLSDLRALNDRYYRDLGADPAALGIRYDLEPRIGKDPVAFTTFGVRPHPAGTTWSPGEPWVFAAYKVGGIDNLAELLHETGHAVHIAAIRGRPAFVDWPDSDTFTEAIADIAALEINEPAWQRKYLGAEVPLAQAIMAKYSGIVMDVAWSLFEIRMHRDPEADPNQVWTAITRDYLRIKPHPELSWWAVRGQLINAPGYMLNYAAGAILVADLRARAREQHGSYAEGDPTWYPWMSERLYRFGLARTSRQVIEDFLGRPVAPGAILDDMSRAKREAAAAFGPFEGSFVDLDLASGRIERINAAQAAERMSPCSTFKIPNSLIGLESGVIKDADFLIPWDGVARLRPAWNRDHTLRTAIAESVVPYYQELARRVGIDRMETFIRAIHYGNQDLSGGIDRFWLDSSLRISADEQVDFLARLYRGELPVSRRSIDIVKEILPRVESGGAVVRGKTGSCVDDRNDRSFGWFVGYAERAGAATIFTVNIRGRSAAGADGMKAREIALRLLQSRTRSAARAEPPRPGLS